ncbi:MAG: hypothetical protein IKX00_00200 [Bacilli bacterium]|nr:hypothetical protein [Bacilli bacterium]
MKISNIKEFLNEIKTPNQLLNYMENNITYGFVGNNGKYYDNPDSDEWNDWYSVCYVQNAKQLLKSHIGICWDQVELEREWFSHNQFNYITIFIWFSVEHKNDYPTHSFLIYEDNNKWYWFENAFFDCTGIHEYNSKTDAINDIKEKFFSYAIENGWAKPEDKGLIMTNEYSKPKDNSTVQEYLNHVTNN